MNDDFEPITLENFTRRHAELLAQCNRIMRGYDELLGMTTVFRFVRDEDAAEYAEMQLA